jgi:hypothetical protein
VTPAQTSSAGPLQRVLDRLAELGSSVKYVSGQYQAQCPAHADDGPSLAVREGDEGVILFCHGGCSSDAVSQALGIPLAELFTSFYKPKRSSTVVPLRASAGTGLTWVCDYLYEDAEGKPAFKIVRFAKDDGGKAFFQHRREQGHWVAGLGGAVPPLYRLPKILEAVARGDVVLLVEGEKDADAAVELNICATTAPGGAAKPWQNDWTETLREGLVIILADADPVEKRFAGQRHAWDAYTALEPVAKQVQLALPPPGYKDLSEALAAGYDPFASEEGAIRLCAPQEFYQRYVATLPNQGELPTGTRTDDSSPVPADPGAGNAQGNGSTTANESTRTVRLKKASGFTLRKVRWGWTDRMPVGELTLVPGREGIGKSLLLAWMAGQLTRGTLPGAFYGEPRAVLYAAQEDSWAHTVGPRLVAAGADLDLVYRVDIEEAGARLTLPVDCDGVANAALEVEAAALMLDPIVSLVDDRLSVNQSRELRQALEPLTRAAERAELMVIALAHFNKMADVDVLSKIPGGRAWSEVARAVFALAADPEEEHFVASQIKNNLGRVDLANLTYAIESALVDTADGMADTGRLVWVGETDIGVEEVLGRRPSERGRDTSEVTQTLVSHIREYGHPMPLEDIYAAFPAMKPDSIRKALRRAADRGELSSPGRGFYGPA